MNFRNALVAATILALPLAANAQPISGLYIGGGAGVNFMQHEHIVVAPVTADMKSRVGPAFSLSAGYGLGNGLRAELEGNYKQNGFTGTDNGIATGGTEQKMGAMVNVLYDFVGVPFVQPYIGVGAGYEWVKESNVHVTRPAPVAFRGLLNTDTEGKFAYQGILGAAMPITPALALTADYRFLGLAGDRSYSGTLNGVPGSAKLNHDYNHSVMVGFRYAFGVAPAEAPMAPAPAAVAPSPISRSYLVFFDWDKANLTDRARQIVSEAAANSTKVQYTRLEVNGYTDTSGTPKYNQGLSVRRAQAVAAELVKDGVPKSAIAIQGFGETHLLVPTGAGVREPQNRRVEIIIK
jgi:OOP family OmpA-OmpF porin